MPTHTPQLEPPDFITSFDSAAAMLRATAHALQGRDLPIPDRRHPVLERIAPLGQFTPYRLRQSLYRWAGYYSSIPARKLASVNTEAISAWLARSQPSRRYPAIVIGSPVGSAVHLAAALDAPFIPQTALISVRRTGIDPDDVEREMQWGQKHAPVVLERNPGIALHHMSDPNQDRLMLKTMAYFRIKLRCLGSALERFITGHLEPGGTLIVLECLRSWPVARFGDRYVFQFGGEGGLSPYEYYRGGPRVAAFLERHGADRRAWKLPAPNAEAPEAEWGFDPAILRHVRALAHRLRCRLLRIRFPDPTDLSPFTARLHHWWYADRRVPVRGLLVESFTLVTPHEALEMGLVPFWTTFPVESQATAVERYLEAAAPYDAVFAFLFSHGVESAGLASIHRWQRIADRGRLDGGLLGVDPTLWPADFTMLARYHDALSKAVPTRHERPARLTVEELVQFNRQHPHAKVELAGDAAP